MTDAPPLADESRHVVLAILDHIYQSVPHFAIIGRSELLAKWLMPELQLRRILAKLLRMRILLSPCRRVYALPLGGGIPLSLSQLVASGPEIFVHIWAQEAGRDISISVGEAEYLAARRIEYDPYCFAVSAATVPLRLRGLVLEPAPDWLWRLPAELHIFAQGLRSQIEGSSEDALRQSGVIFGMRGKREMATLLRKALSLLPHALRLAALGAIAEIEGDGPRPPAARQAPSDFIPPKPDDPHTPTVEQWRIIRLDAADGRNFEVLAAGLTRNHPQFEGQPLPHSSRLVWVDQALGYARTLSRYYRLGEPAP